MSLRTCLDVKKFQPQASANSHVKMCHKMSQKIPDLLWAAAHQSLTKSSIPHVYWVKTTPINYHVLWLNNSGPCGMQASYTLCSCHINSNCTTWHCHHYHVGSIVHLWQALDWQRDQEFAWSSDPVEAERKGQWWQQPPQVCIHHSLRVSCNKELYWEQELVHIQVDNSAYLSSWLIRMYWPGFSSK